MRISSLTKHLPVIAAAGMLAAAATAPALAEASIAGAWEYHTSFDRSCVAILDSPRFTYFHLLQQYHHNTPSTLLTVPKGVIFVHDRENAQQGIVPLSSVSPQATLKDVRTARYNQEKHYLIAVDSDGVIEIYHDNGDIKTITDLAHIRIPGVRDFNSVNFSANGDVWVAADFGIARIDVENGTIPQLIFTDRPVMQAASFEPGVIAMTATGLYCLPADSRGSVTLDWENTITATPLSGSDFLVDVAGIRTPETLMPLSMRTFALMGPTPDGSQGRSVNIMGLDGSTWKIFNILKDQIRTTSPDELLSYSTEGNGLPTLQGYYVHSNNIAYQIAKGIEPDWGAADVAEDFKSKAFTSKYKLSDSWRDSGTFDMHDFWFNFQRKGFYSRRADDGQGKDAQWKDVYGRRMPDGPRPFIADYMVWHPDYGFMVSNRGYTNIFQSNTPVPWLVSGLKDGKWVNYSPVFNPPAYVDTDPELAKVYNNVSNRYPLYNPRGFAVDPDDPRFVYAGSLMSGIGRINLAEPAAPALHISCPEDRTSGLPGFIAGAPSAENWPEACDFTAPSFDSDNTLWTAFNPRYNDKQRSQVEFWYLTSTRRKEMENANTDPSVYKEWDKLTLPLPGKNILATPQFLALASEANRNILAYSSGAFGDYLYLIDHKGTLSDPSDDEVRIVTHSATADGHQINQRYINSIYEDKATGRLWVCCQTGAYSLLPAEEMKGRNTIEMPLREIPVNCVGSDPDGRLWFGTTRGGVICTSSDGKTQIGTLDTYNSGISANDVYGVAYNPDRGSMFISTGNGLCEFFADMLGSDTTSEHVAVSPSRVTSRWRGWITVTGLPAGKEIVVTDIKGDVVRKLGTPDGGRLQWDATGEDGLRVPTGRYHFSVSGDGKPLCEIKIFK